jgi:hypothetical protein
MKTLLILPSALNISSSSAYLCPHCWDTGLSYGLRLGKQAITHHTGPVRVGQTFTLVLSISNKSVRTYLRIYSLYHTNRVQGTGYSMKRGYFYKNNIHTYIPLTFYPRRGRGISDMPRRHQRFTKIS